MAQPAVISGIGAEEDLADPQRYASGSAKGCTPSWSAKVRNSPLYVGDSRTRRYLCQPIAARSYSRLQRIIIRVEISCPRSVTCLWSRCTTLDWWCSSQSGGWRVRSASQQGSAATVLPQRVTRRCRTDCAGVPRTTEASPSFRRGLRQLCNHPSCRPTAGGAAALGPRRHQGCRTEGIEVPRSG